MKEQKKLNNNKKNVIIIRILFNFRNKKVEYNYKKKPMPVVPWFADILIHHKIFSFNYEI